QRVDRSALPLLLAALAGSIVVGVLLTLLVSDSPWYGIFMGLAIGVLIAMLILARKAERAAFGRIKGQPGAALAAMQSIRRGWNVEDRKSTRLNSSHVSISYAASCLKTKRLTATNLFSITGRSPSRRL